MSYYDELLATGGTSEAVLASKNLDFFVSGLLAGSVKLQIRFLTSLVEDPTVWRDIPDAVYTADAIASLYIGEDQARVRAVGTGNTEGTYIRFGRA